MDWRDALTGRIAGAPAWVWGLGLGVIISFVLRQRQKAAGDEVESEGDSENLAAADGLAYTDSADALTSMFPGGFTAAPTTLGGQGFAIAAPIQTADDTTTTNDDVARTSFDDGITSNAEWRRIAIDWAVGAGFDVTESTNGISKVLNGDEVDDGEVAVYSAAVRKFGSPPEGAPTLRVRKQAPTTRTQAPTTPTPTPTPADPPSPTRRPTTVTEPAKPAPTATATPTAPVRTAPAKRVGVDIYPNGESPPPGWTIQRMTVAPGGSLWGTIQNHIGRSPSERAVRDAARRNNIPISGSGTNLRASVRPGQVIWL